MKITPLVLHGGVNIPKWTSVFSDPFPVTQISVVANGQCTITCPSAHGVQIGDKIGVSITDANTPNAITAAAVLGSGDVLITTSFDHDLTTTPDPNLSAAWSLVSNLTGFSSNWLNGNRQLVEVRSARQFVVRPGSEISTITLTGSEKLLERLEAELIGWHSATATSATTLTFRTPDSVMRTYTVLTPIVVRNIRIFGALNPEVAYRQYTQDDAKFTPSYSAMFVCPEATVNAVRASGSKSGAVADIGPGTDYRQMLTDGFEIVVFIPSANSSAHVKAIDLAQGEVFKAVLRSFYGLKLERSELVDGGSYASVFFAHGGASSTNNAVYSHRYTFQSSAYLTNADAIAPWNWSQIDDTAIAAGTPPETVLPIGVPSFHELDFTGILHDGKPQPLLGSFKTS